MRTDTVIDRTHAEIKLGNYAVAGASSLADPALLPRVQEYRRRTGSLMRSLARDDIREKTPSAEYHVSRKIDGEFTVLVYQDGEVFTVNPGGAVRMGLPWEAEAAEMLSKAGVKQAQIAGELYVQCDDRRSRVHDVTSIARQPETPEDLERLRFAAFDIMSLDDEPLESFVHTWQEIERIFGGGTLVHPVEAKFVSGVDDVEKLFEQWVDKEGAEGIVVRSDSAGMYKIKPKHTLDVVVIGFAESEGEREGLLHDLLLGVMRDDGTAQVLCRVGGGFNTEQRREMLCDLKDMAVESEFAEVNSDSVAYQMVRPEWVIEISCLDLIAENTRGGPINKMVLDFDGEYRVVRPLPLATVISPQFIRRREDKQPRPEDTGLDQVTRIVEVPFADRSARQMSLPPCEVLRREVYTKEAKGETMVRKLVAWKTNKETESDEYPAYVLHYTDFSPNRKAPLAREVRVSSCEEQILQLFDGMKEANIKKGWDLAASSGESASVAAPPTPEAKPTKKKAAAPKKATTKAAKKTTKKTTKKATKKAAKKSPKEADAPKS